MLSKFSKKLTIFIERRKNGGDLAVHFYFLKKNYNFFIKKSDDLLEIFEKILQERNNFKKLKFSVKFKGNVGILNKRIAKAIIKTINSFQ